MQIKENMEVVMLPTNSVIPYWRNPRRNDKTVEALVSVIEKHGFDVPIVVDRNNVVVKGHARLRAAKRLGMTEVPCVISDAPDDIIKADRIADNKIQELSMWDFGKLNMELDRLDGKMTFGKLFRPEEGLKPEETQFVPEVQFKPTGLNFGAMDADDGFDVQPVEARHVDVPVGGQAYVSPVPTGAVESVAATPAAPTTATPQQPVKKELKTLCPYCGKVVVINV